MNAASTLSPSPAPSLSRPSRLTFADMSVQTWAMIVAAYRELNARKLFWVALALNVVVILVIAAVGIDEEGISVLGYSLDLPGVTSKLFPPADFYKLMIATLGVGIWLGWLSTILALLSTSSIFPDLASGGVDIMLSKPISRDRLFLTMFGCALLFSKMQVIAFSLMAFLLLGVRAGVWEPGVFLAAPLVIALFSYLFCVQAVVGFMTRSAVASVLITLLFWILVFVVDLGESGTLFQRTASRIELEMAQARLDTMKGEGGRESGERMVAEANIRFERWAFANDILLGIKTCLPKTSETARLTRRALAISAGIGQDPDAEQEMRVDDNGILQRTRANRRRVEAEVRKELDRRTITWVVGTSLAFEGVVLAIGLVYFRRRDY
jgi:hypothetical protein